MKITIEINQEDLKEFLHEEWQGTSGRVPLLDFPIFVNRHDCVTGKCEPDKPCIKTESDYYHKKFAIVQITP